MKDPTNPFEDVVSESGGFEGDVFFGDPENTTRGTHRWTNGAWTPLPSDAEVLTELLAKARAERDDARSLYNATSDNVANYRVAHIAALERAGAAEARIGELMEALEAVLAWKDVIALAAPDLGGLLTAIYRAEALVAKAGGH